MLRQMAQLVRIPYDVYRANGIVVNLERRSLDRSLGCIHNDPGQTINGGKTHGEVFSPAFASGPHQEPRGAIGAVDYVQRRRSFAAAVRLDVDVAREQMHQTIEIAGTCCLDECRQELQVFRIDAGRMH